MTKIVFEKRKKTIKKEKITLYQAYHDYPDKLHNNLSYKALHSIITSNNIVLWVYSRLIAPRFIKNLKCKKKSFYGSLKCRMRMLSIRNMEI